CKKVSLFSLMVLSSRHVWCKITLCAVNRARIAEPGRPVSLFCSNIQILKTRTIIIRNIKHDEPQIQGPLCSQIWLNGNDWLHGTEKPQKLAGNCLRDSHRFSRVSAYL